jgi:hypothetical protein
MPAPKRIEYPRLLDLPKRRLGAHTPAMAIAALGMLNNRLKDDYDFVSHREGAVRK